MASDLFAQDQSTGETATSPLGWVLIGAWLAMVIFLLWRDWPRFFNGPAPAGSGDDASWLAGVLPIVRLRTSASLFPLPLTRRDEVVVLYPGEFVRLRKQRRQSIEAAYRVDGLEELKRDPSLKVKFSIPVNTIEKVVFRKTWYRGFFFDLVRVTVYLPKGKRRFYARGNGVPNLYRALNLLCPSRVVLPPAIKHKWERHKKPEDLSSHRPLRSRPLSVLVKVAAIAFFGLGLWYFWGKSDLGMGLLFLYLGLVGLLQIANGLWERDPQKLLKADSRRPILYLRSFLDDRETSLHPETAFSALVGLDPPFYSIDAYRDTAFYRLSRTIIKNLSNHHPVRLFKLLIGRPLDTSEEQMAAFFSGYGAFVAIGKPGERFATTGAARMYVGNDEWQGLVKDLLHDSEIIVLQPSSTEGVWWEVEQTIQLADPSRVLMCMVNYRGRQNDFETLRLRLEKYLPGGVTVPRATGDHPYITMLRFDNNWQPHELRLFYYSRWIWPFRLRAVNLKRTLEPFLEGCGLLEAKPGTHLHPPELTTP